MEGEYLSCLQEYRYCFASKKIIDSQNISSSHPIIPKVYLCLKEFQS